MHNNTVKSNDRKHSIYHIISDGMFKDGMYFSKSSYFDNVISLISSAQFKKKYNKKKKNKKNSSR